jgi:hypothetical protein
VDEDTYTTSKEVTLAMDEETLERKGRAWKLRIARWLEVVLVCTPLGWDVAHRWEAWSMNQSRQPTLSFIAWLGRFHPWPEPAVYASIPVTVCFLALLAAVRRCLMFISVHLDRQEVDHSSRLVATNHEVGS